jgi:hypothetical protein
MSRKLTISVWLILIMCLSAATTIQAQTKREILTNTKIIELVRIGLSEAVIVEKIRQSECQCDTSTTALAKLKAAKVSDRIIMAMLDAASANSVEPNPRNQKNSTAENEQAVVTNPVQNNSTKSSDSNRMLNQLTEPGIYLLENGKMQQFEPSIFSGSKANPLMGALTYGIKKTKFRAVIRGKAANMQTSNAQPVFYFVFNPEYKNSGATMAGNLWWGMPATSPAEFMLVQMNVKENSREAVMGEIGAWTGAKMGAPDKVVREYSFEKLRPGVYKVIPKASLAPGEYCFYYAGNVSGFGFAGGKVFDFSVKGQ